MVETASRQAQTIEEQAKRQADVIADEAQQKADAVALQARQQADALHEDAARQAAALKLQASDQARDITQQAQERSKVLQDSTQHLVAESAQHVSSSIGTLKNQLAAVDEKLAEAAASLQKATATITGALGEAERDLAVLNAQVKQFPQPLAVPLPDNPLPQQKQPGLESACGRAQRPVAKAVASGLSLEEAYERGAREALERLRAQPPLGALYMQAPAPSVYSTPYYGPGYPAMMPPVMGAYSDSSVPAVRAHVHRVRRVERRQGRPEPEKQEPSKP